jgi:hypothetical protein
MARGDAALIEGNTWHYQYREDPVQAAVLPGVGRELTRHILEAVRLVLRWTDGMPPAAGSAENLLNKALWL